MSEDTFHYSHLLPRKPPLMIPMDERTILCEDCKAPVVTSCRVRKLCGACGLARRHRADQRKTASKRKQRAATKERAQ